MGSQRVGHHGTAKHSTQGVKIPQALWLKYQNINNVITDSKRLLLKGSTPKKSLLKKKVVKKRITHAMSKGSDVIRPPWDWKFLRNIATLLQ